MPTFRVPSAITFALGLVIVLTTLAAQPPRQMENLGRGVVALNQGGGKVFVSWRLLGTDPDDLAFNVYRFSGNGQPAKLNKEPLTKVTFFEDAGVKLDQPTSYFVRPVERGQE